MVVFAFYRVYSPTERSKSTIFFDIVKSTNRNIGRAFVIRNQEYWKFVTNYERG